MSTTPQFDEALVSLLKVGNGLAQAHSNDGKITIPEILGMSGKFVSVFVELSDYKAILEEVKQFKDNPEFIKEKAEFFAEQFDIPQDEIEGAIEDGVTALSAIASIVVRFVK